MARQIEFMNEQKRAEAKAEIQQQEITPVDAPVSKKSWYKFW
jgi:hypothetical protein